ncbi:MAG: hypothetical protein ACRDPA_14575 [Solirubrobacteraceae bacterium]
MHTVPSPSTTKALPRRRWRRAASLAGSLIAIGLLVSGCGGSPAKSSAANPSGANIASQFVAYAACMRSHGLSGYPDPQTSASGNNVQVTISPGSLNPDSPAFKAADRACHRLLPNGGTPAASGPHEQVQDLQFADCMRSHGVPNFPDADRHGAFTLPSTMNQQAPQFKLAATACTHAEPSSLSILNQSPPGS